MVRVHVHRETESDDGDDKTQFGPVCGATEVVRGVDIGGVKWVYGARRPTEVIAPEEDIRHLV